MVNGVRFDTRDVERREALARLELERERTGDGPACEDSVKPSLQIRVHPWLVQCFGPEVAYDKAERSHRFIEESLELVQACGATRDECLQLVDYVYGCPAGERTQEVGGVLITLAALCIAHGVDMSKCGEVELARIWTKIDRIREKQATKPKHSPLPEARC
jgi:NTP pyrophosphatase (non-canonical NTP hydrolase)